MQFHCIKSAHTYSAKVHVAQPRAQSAIVRRTSNVTHGSRLRLLESCVPEEQEDTTNSKELSGISYIGVKNNHAVKLKEYGLPGLRRSLQ